MGKTHRGIAAAKKRDDQVRMIAIKFADCCPKAKAKTVDCKNMRTLHKKNRAFTLIELFVVAVLVSFTIPTGSSAATVTVSGTMRSTSDYGTDFRTGDQFDYSFTFDDQTLDTGVETYRGLFSAGLSAFSLTQHASNTGTWNPTSGSFAVSPVRNFAINANGEDITIQADGSGFPTVGGSPFLDVYLSFSWISGSGTNIARDFVDTGSGQTFADMVGVSPLDFSTAGGYVYGQIRPQDGPNNGPYFTLTVDRTRVVAATPSLAMQGITRTPTSATIQFRGVVGNAYTVLRSGTAHRHL